MFLMKYLGVASAVGVPCDVPLVLRSLANSLAFLTPAEFPIPIDKDFLSWLGASFLCPHSGTRDGLVE